MPHTLWKKGDENRRKVLALYHGITPNTILRKVLGSAGREKLNGYSLSIQSVESRLDRRKPRNVSF